MADIYNSRRRLLQFMAASPLLAREAFADALRSFDPMEWAPRDLDKLIDDPAQAIDVFDFEPVMRQKVPPAHFGYMAASTMRQRCAPTARAFGNSRYARAG